MNFAVIPEKDHVTSDSSSVGVEQLAGALLRVNLPETENIFRVAGTMLIESDEDRHVVATRLADISRDKKHQLRDVIKQLNLDMGGLDRSIINCLVFMNRATEQWQAQSPLDPFVRKSLMRRRYILAALLLDQPEFVLDPKHPVNEILGLVEDLFLGWEEEKGQPPTFVMKSLNVLTRLLDADHCLIREEQELARNALFGEWEKEQKRRKMMEDRLIQSELGLDNVWYAQQLAIQTINKFAAGKTLPPDISQFLSTVWLDSMRLIILSKGEESREFQLMFKLTDRIVFTYKGQHSAGQMQRLYDYAGQLVDELQNHLHSLDKNPDEQERQLVVLQNVVLQIIKQQEVAREEFNALECEFIDVDQSSVSDIVNELQELQGKWFRKFDRMCRLVHILPRQQAILWSDFSGRKVALEPAKEFYAEWRSGKKGELTQSTRLQEICSEVALEIVATDVAHRKALQMKLEEERSIRAAAKAKAEAEAKAIMAAREEAQRKKDAERAEIEERMRQQAIEEEERRRLQAEHDAVDAIDSLRIGGWAHFEKDGKEVRAKLGVRFNATGRLVFVDEFGMKLAELQRDEAKELILAGKFKLLGADADLEERLSRAVGRIGIAKR
ncbi:hypothetical protein BTA51_07455 [Hahella sp. CCB-MM4]|uniref:DUF1631 family protein n=1 Tax=Hahella sp. (strain CCB-MM4) TaxID=1926491 RepID=UPI000B9B94F3|nr:DUF1631 family protein [Hahella sp. CCB-MM4]OZG73649.1 hypothetical protein BTA51_07455 [Hahella sp. CCB-MM4]